MSERDTNFTTRFEMFSLKETTEKGDTKEKLVGLIYIHNQGHQVSYQVRGTKEFVTAYVQVTSDAAAKKLEEKYTVSTISAGDFGQIVKGTEWKLTLYRKVNFAFGFPVDTGWKREPV